ncbi:hypothetical protein [Streptomyces eurythermus]|uniref:hypothetical protein n=1 Tax=Streptomyces eurythermus TaxID=42237 RepID=UPI0033E02BE2
MTMAVDGKTATYIGDPAGNLVTSAMPTTETENRTYDRAGRITAVTASDTETAIRADAQLDRVAQTAASQTIPRPTSIRSVVTCSSNRISSTRESDSPCPSGALDAGDTWGEHAPAADGIGFR